MTSFYTEKELESLGLKSYGNNVLISRNTQFYTAEKITMGNNVRVDDYCILSGEIILGSHIHIAPYCVLYGAHGIKLEDYTGLSARVTIYSAIDDFNGDFLTGSVHDDSMRNLIKGNVMLNKFVQIGAGCIIFPNLIIGEGSAIGSMSLVNKSIDKWGIYVGIPVKRLKDRNRGLLKFIEK